MKARLPIAIGLLVTALTLTFAATNGEAPSLEAQEPPPAATVTEATAGTLNPLEPLPSSESIGTALTVTCKPDGRCLEREFGEGVVRVNGHGPEHWWNQARKAERRVVVLERRLQKRWAATADYAYHLAASLYGISERELRSVGWCESRHAVWADNPISTAGGLMQYLAGTFSNTILGRAGFSRFDPIAAALMAARYNAQTGDWQPWLASRGCHGL